MGIGFAADAASWDRAYSNRAAVTNTAEWMAETAEKARRFRADHPSSGQGIAYAPGPRRDFDIFEPGTDALGTLIFIHGGYWRAGTRQEHSHFAAGALAEGWRVAIPEYPLCPDVRVGEISHLMTQATEAIASRCPDGPIVLSGHSAGGQLAAYVVSEGSGLSRETRERIRLVVSLSGVHDLRPLLFTSDLNGSLLLDQREADEFSPVLRRPGHAFELACVCGGAELAEFRRQNALLANIWQGFGLTCSAIEYEGRNHFTLLDLMSDRDSAMTRLLTDRSSQQPARG